MSHFTSYPSLYQINGRTWVNQRARQLGGAATLADIADSELDAIASLGFDWVYLLGIWRRGENGRRMSRQDARLRQEALQYLPDLKETEICGSCFRHHRLRGQPGPGRRPGAGDPARTFAPARPALDAGFHPQPYSYRSPLGL